LDYVDSSGGPTPGESTAVEGSMLAQLSNAMVRLFKEQFGRGPTKVRSSWAGPDTLITVLEHTFTPAERHLAEMGEHERVRDLRSFFQQAGEDAFRAMVEELSGRRVRSFMSGIDTKNDVSVEVFLLDPEEGLAPDAELLPGAED
jgi:uncharacterized protein YbcI